MTLSGALPVDSSSPQEVGCLVVSDLHRGAAFADIKESQALLDEQLAKPTTQHCVLLGDIYECLNLPKPDTVSLFPYQQTIAYHMNHLQDMVERHPHCQFHYVLGNHERTADFDRAVFELAERLKKRLGPGRLQLTRHYAKIGNALFVHGDQQMSPDKYTMGREEDEGNAVNSKVPRAEEHKPRGLRKRIKQVAQTVLPRDWTDAFYPSEEYVERYWIGNRERKYNALERPLNDFFNRIAPKMAAKHIFTLERCSNQVLQWAHLPQNEGVLDGIDHLYMGHTHGPFTAKPFVDKQTGKTYHFYNTGGSIFRIAHINRHCFNAQSIVFAPKAKDAANADVTNAEYKEKGLIALPEMEVRSSTSVKWPERNWQASTAQSSSIQR